MSVYIHMLNETEAYLYCCMVSAETTNDYCFFAGLLHDCAEKKRKAMRASFALLDI